MESYWDASSSNGLIEKVVPLIHFRLHQYQKTDHWRAINNTGFTSCEIRVIFLCLFLYLSDL